MSLLTSILQAYLRHALTVAAGYLLAQGLIQQADQQVIISAGLALAAIAWSTLNKFVHAQELRLAKAATPSAQPAPLAKGPP